MELSKCKIGIRPTIDGRWGGIREGLEEQTMGMAKAAKALIEANLTYSAGTGRDRRLYDRRRPGSGAVRG